MSFPPPDPGPGRIRPSIQQIAREAPVWSSVVPAELDEFVKLDKAERYLSAEEIKGMFQASLNRARMRRDQAQSWWPYALIIAVVVFLLYVIATGGLNP